MTYNSSIADGVEYGRFPSHHLHVERLRTVYIELVLKQYTAFVTAEMPRGSAFSKVGARSSRHHMMLNRHPCKSIVKGKARSIWARSGERAVGLIGICRRARLPLGGWFLLSCRTGHPFAASGW